MMHPSEIREIRHQEFQNLLFNENKRGGGQNYRSFRLQQRKAPNYHVCLIAVEQITLQRFFSSNTLNSQLENYFVKIFNDTLWKHDFPPKLTVVTRARDFTTKVTFGLPT